MNTASAGPSGPLTPEDFDRLDDELDALRAQDDEIPQWEFCEGFLAALLCMRREVPPEEYWPVLLGEDFRPMEHMEFVWRWKRRWQEIAFALDQPVEVLEDERTYHPEAIDTRGAILSLPLEERLEGDADHGFDRYLVTTYFESRSRIRRHHYPAIQLLSTQCVSRRSDVVSKR